MSRLASHEARTVKNIHSVGNELPDEDDMPAAFARRDRRPFLSRLLRQPGHRLASCGKNTLLSACRSATGTSVYDASKSRAFFQRDFATPNARRSSARRRRSGPIVWQRFNQVGIARESFNSRPGATDRSIRMRKPANMPDARNSRPWPEVHRPTGLAASVANSALLRKADHS